MLRMLFATRPAALLLSGLFLVAPSASAQLKLPKQKVKDRAGTSGPALSGSGKTKPVRNGMAPHLVCTVCDHHNYLGKLDRPNPDGTYQANCQKCSRDTSQKRSAAVADAARIKLPSGNPIPMPSGNGQPRTSPLRSAGETVRYGDTAAGFIIREIRTVDALQGADLERAVESLIGLGEEGLLIARIVLHENLASVALTAGRVLVRAGQDVDAERVVARLHTQMPGKSGVFLLDELVRRNPVYGSPDFLTEMLEHQQKPVRVQAEKLLKGLVSPALLPRLRTVLDSKRSDTRLAVIRLIEKLDDPAVQEILLDRMDDPSARVSGEVLRALARRSDERLNLELLARALNGNWILRENSFALLAILEREDDSLVPILDDRHSAALLQGLRSRDPLVRGTCAAALAGIGFRSASPGKTDWLDLEVTGTMIAAISGREFHNDFSVMQPRVLRRLRLLTGADFGTDGPEWTRWWVDNRSTFYAHRAFLAVPKGSENTLALHFRGTDAAGGVFSMFGSESWSLEGQNRASVGEVLILNRRECMDLLALMEREETLGPEFPPGLRGTKGYGQRELEVIIDGHGKDFIFGVGRTAPWFEKILAAMTDLRERNSWQRYRPSHDYADAFKFWEGESGWWAGEHDVHERGLRLKGLVFTAIQTMPPSERQMALNELDGLYKIPGVPGESDFTLLLDLLRDEGFYTERAKMLVALGIRAAASLPDGSEGSVDRKMAGQLIELLMARFSGEGLVAMGQVASACGRDYVVELAESDIPMYRAVAAAEFSRGPSEQERSLLINMLDDREELVQATAASALGVAHVEEARTELLLRARIAPPMVRAAALRAVGQLGGEYVLEALVLGSADPDLVVKRGAAEGLAILSDPQSAPLLISLLRQGRGSAIFDTAREGLIQLGESARSDLRRIVSSPAHSARRECALLLGRLSDPWVAAPLIELLGADPDDQQVAFELSVLTCVDYTTDPDPSISWGEWYDGVTHGNAQVWLMAALERMGIPVPPGANFSAGVGARQGGLILLQLLSGDSRFMVERARRDLSAMMGADLGGIPPLLADRNAWFVTLRENLLERFEG